MKIVLEDADEKVTISSELLQEWREKLLALVMLVKSAEIS